MSDTSSSSPFLKIFKLWVVFSLERTKLLNSSKESSLAFISSIFKIISPGINPASNAGESFITPVITILSVSNSFDICTPIPS